MSLMDELEAAAQAGAREPTGMRARRKVGAALAAFGVVLTLIAAYGTSWHVMDFNVWGRDNAQIKVGLWKAEVCGEGRDGCVEVSRAEVMRFAGELSTRSDADIAAWLDHRWRVGAAMLVAAAAAAVLAGLGFARRHHPRARLVAAVVGALGMIAGVLLLRSLTADAVAFMGRGIAAYLAAAAVFDILLAAALIGSVRSDPALAPAIVVGTGS